MKLLFIGDLAATGFGTVTTDLGRALLAAGADVRFVSQNEMGTLPPPFDSRAVDLALLTGQEKRVTGGTVEMGFDGIRDFLPDLIAGFASEVALHNGEPWGDWKPEAIILLGDFAAARMFSAPYMESFASLPTFHYVPIEGRSLPPSWASLWKTLRPVAMSKFGQLEIAKVTGVLPPLAYHGVDTDVFHPVSPSNPIRVPLENDETVTLQSKEMCKRFFGVDPRHTLVFRADRNMPRKGYNALLRSMAPVLEARPEVVLAIHCMAYDQGGNLFDSVSKLSPQAQSQIVVTNMHGIPREALVAMYNAADLYVSTSAEGFGLTIAEALACGVPTVGLNYSAVPEVVGPAGLVVPIAGEYDNEYDHYWAVPDEAKFGETVSYLLDHPARRRALGQLGPRHIAETFRWDAAAQTFISAMQAQEVAVAA